MKTGSSIPDFDRYTFVRDSRMRCSRSCECEGRDEVLQLYGRMRSENGATAFPMRAPACGTLHPFWLALHTEHGVEECSACPGAEDLLARCEYGVLGAAVFVQVNQEVRLYQNPVVGAVDGVVGVVVPD